MCGRFTNKMFWREIRDLYGATDLVGKIPRWNGKINIVPVTRVPVIYYPDGKRKLALMECGVNPSMGEGD